MAKTFKSVKSGGVKLAGATPQAALPTIAPNSPFYLVGNSRCYHVNMARTKLVPALRQFVVEAGANLFEETGRGLSHQQFFDKATAEGDVVLRNTDEYLQEVEVVGGVCYITKFETAHPRSNRTRADTAAWDKFCEEQISVIGKPTIDVLETGLRAALANVDTYAVGDRPSDKVLADRYRAEAKVWQAAIDELDKPAKVSETKVSPK